MPFLLWIKTELKDLDNMKKFRKTESRNLLKRVSKINHYTKRKKMNNKLKRLKELHQLKNPNKPMAPVYL